jgi:hypothetical protein
MGFKSLKLATAATALILSTSANAAIIDNGTYTTDTSTGLDWLDLTATAGMSYNQVSAELGAGGIFEGWTYATRAQVSGFWDSFGGDSNYYNGWSTQNNGLFDAMAPLVGDLYCASTGCATGDGFSYWLTADFNSASTVFMSRSWDSATANPSATGDDFSLSNYILGLDQSGENAGSALVRVSAVPVPAAAWLFGSGLLGLIGVARRKKSA